MANRHKLASCLTLILTTIGLNCYADNQDCSDLVGRLGYHVPLSGGGSGSLARVGDAIHITGDISQKLVTLFKATDLNGVRRLVLKSRGGQVPAGLELAKLIKDNSLNTVLPENSFCESMCTVIFQAGRERTMHSRSYLGYHSAEIKVEDDHAVKVAGRILEGLGLQNPVTKKEEEATGQMVASLEGNKLSPQITKVLKSVSGKSMHCINAEEAKRYNAATVLDGPSLQKIMAPAKDEATGGLLDGVPKTDRPLIIDRRPGRL